MRGRVAELAVVAILSLILTIAVAAPVLQAPSDRVFGMPIVGRQHDPFTVMTGFDRPVTVGVYTQPLTDVPGALLARASGPVAAYNWLVLLTFPLSALAAYALARHLHLSAGAATLAALLFAFSPVHLAHAAYHPHVAQTQWLPLYLLALWRCLDHSTWRAAVLLMAAVAGVTLSNFYGGFIAAVITPVAIAGYWWFRSRHRPRASRHLAITLATLLVLVGGGFAYAAYAAPAVLQNRAAFAFPVDDIQRYSARWWSYFLPPVAHPVLGRSSLLIWHDADAGAGLLEQQVYVGWGVVALTLVAVIAWVRRAHAAALSITPALIAVTSVALACSIAPPLWLHGVAPMFRSYARFGVVAQLMAVLLAGLGADVLWRSRHRAATIALLLVVVFDYAVWPRAMSRDVLPTPAHRWVMDEPGRVFTLDCAGATPESESIPWLSGGRIALVRLDTDDCLQPNLGDALVSDGYTHVLLRRHTPEGRWFARHGTPDGLRMVAWFDDAEVFAVTAARPQVYTARMAGFSPRESTETETWRWMGDAASWTVVNTSAATVVAVVDVDLSAFLRARRVRMLLDGRAVQDLTVGTTRQSYRLGPFTLTPGPHMLAFHPEDPPTIADDVVNNGDDRALSIAAGSWRWLVEGSRP